MLALGKQRQEDEEFKASLDDTGRFKANLCATLFSKKKKVLREMGQGLKAWALIPSTHTAAHNCL